jgi:hypothetical protein
VRVGFLLSIPFWLVAIAAIIAMFGATLWFWARAFQKSVWWGLGVLLLPGLCSLALVILDWDRFRDPVKVYALAIVGLLIGTTGVELFAG